MRCFAVQALTQFWHIIEVPGGVGFGDEGVQRERHTLQDRAGDEFLVDQNSNCLAESTVVHRAAAVVEAHVTESVELFSDHLEVRVSLHLVRQTALQTERVDHIINLAVLHRQDSSILRTVDGVND